MAAVQVPAPAGSATGQDNGTTRGSALSSQQDGSQQRQDASTSSSALQHLGRASGLETGSGSTPSPSLLATTSSTSLRQQDDVVDQPPAEPAPRQASTQSTYLGKTHVSSLEASLSSNAKGKQRAISQQPVRASSGDASGGSSTANLARLFEATELERLRVENQLLKRQSQVLAVKRGRLQVTRQVVGDQDGEDQRLDKQVKGLKSDNRLLSQRLKVADSQRQRLETELRHLRSFLLNKVLPVTASNDEYRVASHRHEHRKEAEREKVNAEEEELLSHDDEFELEEDEEDGSGEEENDRSLESRRRLRQSTDDQPSPSPSPERRQIVKKRPSLPFSHAPSNVQSKRRKETPRRKRRRRTTMGDAETEHLLLASRRILRLEKVLDVPVHPLAQHSLFPDAHGLRTGNGQPFEASACQMPANGDSEMLPATASTHSQSHELPGLPSQRPTAVVPFTSIGLGSPMARNSARPAASTSASYSYPFPRSADPLPAHPNQQYQHQTIQPPLPANTDPFKTPGLAGEGDRQRSSHHRSFSTPFAGNAYPEYAGTSETPGAEQQSQRAVSASTPYASPENKVSAGGQSGTPSSPKKIGRPRGSPNKTKTISINETASTRRRLKAQAFAEANGGKGRGRGRPRAGESAASGHGQHDDGMDWSPNSRASPMRPLGLAAHPDQLGGAIRVGDARALFGEGSSRGFPPSPRKVPQSPAREGLGDLLTAAQTVGEEYEYEIEEDDDDDDFEEEGLDDDGHSGWPSRQVTESATRPSALRPSDQTRYSTSYNRQQAARDSSTAPTEVIYSDPVSVPPSTPPGPGNHPKYPDDPAFSTPDAAARQISALDVLADQAASASKDPADLRDAAAKYLPVRHAPEMRVDMQGRSVRDYQDTRGPSGGFHPAAVRPEHSAVRRDALGDAFVYSSQAEGPQKKRKLSAHYEPNDQPHSQPSRGYSYAPQESASSLAPPPRHLSHQPQADFRQRSPPLVKSEFRSTSEAPRTIAQQLQSGVAPSHPLVDRQDLASGMTPAAALAKKARSPYLKWTLEEDEQLIKGIAEHGTKWESVASSLASRSYHQCRQRWLRGLKSGDALPESLKQYRPQIDEAIERYEQFKASKSKSAATNVGRGPSPDKPQGR